MEHRERLGGALSAVSSRSGGGCGARRIGAGRRSTSGLILPFERRASSDAPGCGRASQQLHHFVSVHLGRPARWQMILRPPNGWWAGPDSMRSWTTPRSLRGPSLGRVKRQYCGRSQAANAKPRLLTLARRRSGLRPAALLCRALCADAVRRAATGVPVAVAYRRREGRAGEIDLVLAAGPGSLRAGRRGVGGPPSSAPASRSGASPPRGIPRPAVPPADVRSVPRRANRPAARAAPCPRPRAWPRPAARGRRGVRRSPSDRTRAAPGRVRAAVWGWPRPIAAGGPLRRGGLVGRASRHLRAQVLPLEPPPDPRSRLAA